MYLIKLNDKVINPNKLCTFCVSLITWLISCKLKDSDKMCKFCFTFDATNNITLAICG